MPRVYVTVRRLTGLSPATERQEVSEISIEEYDLFGSPSSFIKGFIMEDLESEMHSMQNIRLGRRES